jgi:hypothetical protein
MGRHDTIHVNQARRLWLWAGMLPVAVWLSVLASGTAQSAGYRAPEQCQSYTGEEHLKCLYEYIGIRDDKPAAAGAQEKVEQEMFDQIREQRDQVDRMSSGTPEPRQRLEPRPQRSPAAAAPPPASTAEAPSFLSPYECRAYSGQAHLNCLYAYIEIQRNKEGKVQQELQAQKESLGQLRDQVDRQQQLEQQPASSPPVTAVVPAPIYPPIYGYGYGSPGYGYLGLGYSTPGLSLFFGTPGLYYGRPFYGPRFFGPRFYGPRFYGPRGFGHRRR